MKWHSHKDAVANQGTSECRLVGPWCVPSIRPAVAAVILPVLILLAIHAGSNDQTPTSSPPDIREVQRFNIDVTGRNFVWQFQISGREQASASVRDEAAQGILWLPARSEVTFRVTSDDYVYVFEIPGACREAAVPGIINTVRYIVPESGIVDLPADPLCAFGPQHDKLMGRLIVEAVTGTP